MLKRRDLSCQGSLLIDVNGKVLKINKNIKKKNIPNQDFIMRNISCEFEISTYNTLCSRGPPKVLVQSRKTPVAAILFFKMMPKIFPGKILWLCIYPANLIRLAIIFFSLER